MLLHAERITAIGETNNPELFTKDMFVQASAQLTTNGGYIAGTRITFLGIGITEAIEQWAKAERNEQADVHDAFRAGLNGNATYEARKTTFALVLTTVTRDDAGTEIARLGWRFDGCEIKKDEQGNTYIESTRQFNKPIFRIEQQ